jgi:hypothetical protein
VKLFLAEQKPLSVSRDGSPTDTSGTESEIPSFIYGRGDDFKERPLVTRRIDVPAALPLAEDLRGVAVEDIELVGTTVEGVVRVRNLTFEKWLAVRFTLSKWQTTSEGTARYKESLPTPGLARTGWEWGRQRQMRRLGARRVVSLCLDLREWHVVFIIEGAACATLEDSSVLCPTEWGCVSALNPDLFASCTYCYTC